jgi:putative membrane protein
MNWGDWSLDPSLVYVAVSAALYWLGGRRRGEEPSLRTAAFAAGLATIVIALDSPIDAYADQLFWVHMVQHILLLTVAPPLILLGRPWPRMWRALPLELRTAVGRGLARSRLAAPVRRLAHPLPAWLLFNATIVGWHIPAAYEATLSYGSIHLLEHAMFFFIGLLFWARIVNPGPLRPRLEYPARVAYIIGTMIVGWMLAVTLVVVQHPLYSHYAALSARPGGISAMTDQQIAAGIMWVPGSVAYAIAALICFYRWLEPQSARPRIPVLPT